MDNKARITYRFDHHKKDFHAALPDSKKHKTLNEFTTEFADWNSPFDMDTEHLAKFKSHAIPIEAEVSVEPPSELHAASLLPDGVMTYSESLPESNRPAGNRHGLFRMMFSFFGALAGGLLLGYFALQFFSASTQSNETIATSSIPEQSMPDAAIFAGDEPVDPVGAGLDEKDAPVEAYALHLPASTFYLLQHGMFTSEDKAIEASNALKRRGLASTAVRTDHIYIFAGILTLKDDAIQMSQLLQADGFETYIKPFELSAVETLAWTGNSEEQLTGYFQEGRELVRMLSELSYLYIQPHSPNGLSASAMEQLHQRHQTWSNHALGLGQSMPEEVKNIIQKMNMAMNTAVTALDEYNKSPNSSYVWQVQEAMLDYVHEETKLIQS